MLKNLLERGYFPGELPPPFVTAPFADFVITGSLPTPFTKKKAPITKICRFNLARNGLKRRQLGIANPISQYRIANFLVENWKYLGALCDSSRPSLSTPVFRNKSITTNRAFDHTGFEKIARKRDSYAVGMRYTLKADINKCYNSVYTHAVNWAIDGKAAAKKATHSSPSGPGFHLDTEIRAGQDRQSIGIPIGPDTSFLTAETMLSCIDYDLSQAFPKSYFRLMDDYEFFFKDYASCLKAEKILSEVLASYELTLNDSKTGISELPIASSPVWLQRLQAVPHNKSDVVYARHLLDAAFEIRREFRDAPVIRYAFQAASALIRSPIAWSETQYSVMNLATHEPGLLPQIIDMVDFHRRVVGSSVDLGKFGEVLDSVMEESISRRHLSELSWAIWAHILFRIPIGPARVNQIASVECSVVALLMLDATNQGLVSKYSDYSTWSKYWDAEELDGEQWLLSYETDFKGWQPGVKRLSYTTKKDGYREMAKAGVYFYDESRTQKYIPGFKLRGNRATAKRILSEIHGY